MMASGSDITRDHGPWLPRERMSTPFGAVLCHADDRGVVVVESADVPLRNGPLSVAATFECGWDGAMSSSYGAIGMDEAYLEINDQLYLAAMDYFNRYEDRIAPLALRQALSDLDILQKEIGSRTVLRDAILVPPQPGPEIVETIYGPMCVTANGKTGRLHAEPASVGRLLSLDGKLIKMEASFPNYSAVSLNLRRATPVQSEPYPAPDALRNSLYQAFCQCAESRPDMVVFADAAGKFFELDRQIEGLRQARDAKTATVAAINARPAALESSPSPSP